MTRSSRFRGTIDESVPAVDRLTACGHSPAVFAPFGLRARQFSLHCRLVIPLRPPELSYCEHTCMFAARCGVPRHR